MEKTSQITNPIVTDYLNRFYSPLNPQMMNLRLSAEPKDFLCVPENITHITHAVGAGNPHHLALLLGRQISKRQSVVDAGITAVQNLFAHVKSPTFCLFLSYAALHLQ